MAISPFAGAVAITPLYTALHRRASLLPLLSTFLPDLSAPSLALSPLRRSSRFPGRFFATTVRKKINTRQVRRHKASPRRGNYVGPRIMRPLAPCVPRYIVRAPIALRAFARNNKDLTKKNFFQNFYTLYIL